MSLKTPNAEGDPRESDTPADRTATESGVPAAEGASIPTRNARMLAAPSSDRCAVCGAGLAIDQRYCVECGTRRGPARFALSAARSTPSSEASGVAATRSSSLRVTVLAGLIALLLAFGIGMLVGHDTASAGKPVKVVVNSSSPATGGSSGATAGSGSSSSSGGSGSNGGSSSNSASGSNGTAGSGSSSSSGGSGSNGGSSSSGTAGSGSSSSSGGSGSNGGSGSSSGNFFSQ